MNASTFVGDLMAEMLPLLELERLSSNPRYKQAFAREIMNPSRMHEAFETAVILDNLYLLDMLVNEYGSEEGFRAAAILDSPVILDKLIDVYGYPNGLDPNNGEWDENAPVQSGSLIVDLLLNRSTKSLAYLYSFPRGIRVMDLESAIAIALDTIIERLELDEISLEQLYQVFDTLLVANPRTRAIADLSALLNQQGKRNIANLITTYILSERPNKLRRSTIV